MREYRPINNPKVWYVVFKVISKVKIMYFVYNLIRSYKNASGQLQIKKNYQKPYKLKFLSKSALYRVFQEIYSYLNHIVV